MLLVHLAFDGQEGSFCLDQRTMKYAQYNGGVGADGWLYLDHTRAGSVSRASFGYVHEVGRSDDVFKKFSLQPRPIF